MVGSARAPSSLSAVLLAREAGNHRHNQPDRPRAETDPSAQTALPCRTPDQLILHQESHFSSCSHWLPEDPMLLSIAAADSLRRRVRARGMNRSLFGSLNVRNVSFFNRLPSEMLARAAAKIKCRLITNIVMAIYQRLESLHRMFYLRDVLTTRKTRCETNGRVGYS